MLSFFSFENSGIPGAQNRNITPKTKVIFNRYSTSLLKNQNLNVSSYMPENPLNGFSCFIIQNTFETVNLRFSKPARFIDSRWETN